MSTEYDAILLLSFGGPEGPDEVMPFLERVVAGRPVPRERLVGVSKHYLTMGGVSPINARVRELIAALEAALADKGPKLPIYWGNRFWHPLLEETVTKMRDDGRKRVLCVVTSAYSSWSGCRAYWRDIERAREAVPGAPEIDRVRTYFNHPGFVETCIARVREGLETLGDRAGEATVLFSAHSIPNGMAAACDYEEQLAEVARLCTEALSLERTQIVYQSRSGPPRVPWLEPDVGDAIRTLAEDRPSSAVLVAPIGFVADHMEVVWDLDTEARAIAEECGLTFARAPAANVHPAYVEALRDLIEERVSGREERPTAGRLPARPDTCRPGCCPDGRPGRPLPRA